MHTEKILAAISVVIVLALIGLLFYAAVLLGHDLHHYLSHC